MDVSSPQVNSNMITQVRAAFDRPWTLAAMVGAAVITLPLIAIAVLAFGGSGETWPHLLSTVLPGSTANTLLLASGAAIGTAIIGTGAAWIVTMYRFPGRELLDRLLVLPLAMPVYIVAYAYADVFDYAGPVQTALRSTFGWTSPNDYWFPNIRSLGGAIGLFTLVLYPYVYLSARASFVQQSVCVLEVARTLGRTPAQTFWRVALPLARPALVAGLLLVVMESLNDLGAVQYLGVETLSASVFSTWTQRGSLAGAAQISLVMLGLVVVLIAIERHYAAGGTVSAATGRFRPIPFEDLSSWRAMLALLLVATPVILGFVLPVIILASRAFLHAHTIDVSAFGMAALNSLTLAAMVAILCVLAALLFAYASRFEPGRPTSLANRVVTFGYALPGTVLAVGLMSPLAGFDNALDGWMREHVGVSTGLILSGSLFAITLALVIRFMAVALGTISAGIGQISPNLDSAARTLGSGGFATLRRIHLPMLRPALGAAALLVFVDAMKELPATLLLRPFNFETLATYIYGLAAAERPEEAALGALTIVVIGLAPVLWLHRTIAGGRTGSGA